jgi:hypothetical protein
MHITDVLTEHTFEEFHVCAACLERIPWDLSRWASDRPPERLDGGLRFVVTRIYITELSDQQIVYLQECGGEHVFPLICGIFEATALDRQVKKMPSPRPLTHDAWADTITALGARLCDVFITELRENTYFARLRLRQGTAEAAALEALQSAAARHPTPALSRRVEVDVRPSDALKLALREGVPIFIKETVLQSMKAQDEADLRAQAQVTSGIPDVVMPMRTASRSQLLGPVTAGPLHTGQSEHSGLLAQKEAFILWRLLTLVLLALVVALAGWIIIDRWW